MIKILLNGKRKDLKNCYEGSDDVWDTSFDKNDLKKSSWEEVVVFKIAD